MPPRSHGMHIHGTRIASGRFNRHLTHTAPADEAAPFETTASRVARGHARARLEHLHADFELEQRFSRAAAA